MRARLHFPGCQMLPRVDRGVTDEDGTVRHGETRYFVTSIRPEEICADELLVTVHRHSTP